MRPSPKTTPLAQSTSLHFLTRNSLILMTHAVTSKALSLRLQNPMASVLNSRLNFPISQPAVVHSVSTCNCASSTYLPPLTSNPVYHIHAHPVPSDGNCTGTLAHLDPFIRGENPPCDTSLPQTCQVGDLSGKYGKVTSDPFQAFYVDEFASTLPGLGSFFGNRSLTVHFGNTTRITCANFTLLEGVVGRAGLANSTNVTATSTGGPLQYTGTGAAGKLTVQGGLLAVMGVVLGFAL